MMLKNQPKALADQTLIDCEGCRDHIPPPQTSRAFGKSPFGAGTALVACMVGKAIYDSLADCFSRDRPANSPVQHEKRRLIECSASSMTDHTLVLTEDLMQKINAIRTNPEL